MRIISTQFDGIRVNQVTTRHRTYYFGAVWPLGREHACDLAQIRTFERDIEAMVTNAEQEHAA